METIDKSKQCGQTSFLNTNFLVILYQRYCDCPADSVKPNPTSKPASCKQGELCEGYVL